MNLEFKVENQKLWLSNRNVLASGSAEYLKANFTFSKEWEGLTKTAVFYIDKEDTKLILLENDGCTIPHEVLTDQTILYVGVFGVLDETVITTEIKSFLIRQGVIEEGTIKPPSLDIYMQILNALVSKQDKLIAGKNITIENNVISSTGGGGGGTGYHDELENRKLADQHPINAITDLEEELNRLQKEIDDIDVEIPNASETIVGGIKIRYDNVTETLFITNNGSNP